MTAAKNYNGDPTLRHYNLGHIVAACAYEAVRISPHPVPADLETVLEKLSALLKPRFHHVADRIFLSEMTYAQMSHALWQALQEIHEFKMWNVSRVLQRQGHDIDTQPDGPVFLSRVHGPPSPDHDFVDLDAFHRNAAHLIQQLEIQNSR